VLICRPFRDFEVVTENQKIVRNPSLAEGSAEYVVSSVRKPPETYYKENVEW